MKILVTDGGERSALAAARSLTKAGHEVHVSAPTRLSLAGVSRRVRGHVLTTDPLANSAGYVAELGQLLRSERIQVLLPVTDAGVEAVLRHRQILPSDLVIPLPDLATYRRASDKHELLELARQAGFAVPETLALESPADTRWRDARFPAVLKPHRSVVGGESGVERRSVAVSVVDDPRECERLLRELPASAFPVLLQQRVAGEGQGLFVLRWNGKTVACFAHRRLRDKPPAGGVSVYREAIAPHPALKAAGERLLDALGWQGVAMIECRREARTGRYVIMEVNGRLWGSLQLAIDAGVDFPRLLIDCALGCVPHVDGMGYRVGVRSRWFWGDVDQLYLRFTRSAAELNLPLDDQSRLRAVLAFLAFRPGRDKAEIWRLSDPAPFLVETVQWFGGLTGRGR